MVPAMLQPFKLSAIQLGLHQLILSFKTLGDKNTDFMLVGKTNKYTIAI